MTNSSIECNDGSANPSVANRPQLPGTGHGIPQSGDNMPRRGHVTHPTVFGPNYRPPGVGYINLGYGIPLPSYSISGPSQGLPPPNYSIPSYHYSIPPYYYGIPGLNYSIPLPNYSVPGLAYSIPTPNYSTPGPSCGVAQPNYSIPRPNYSIPGHKEQVEAEKKAFKYVFGDDATDDTVQYDLEKDEIKILRHFYKLSRRLLSVKESPNFTIHDYDECTRTLVKASRRGKVEKYIVEGMKRVLENTKRTDKDIMIVIETAYAIFALQITNEIYEVEKALQSSEAKRQEATRQSETVFQEEEATQPQEATQSQEATQLQEAAQPQEGTQPQEATQPQGAAQPQEAAQPQKTTQPQDATQPQEATQSQELQNEIKKFKRAYEVLCQLTQAANASKSRNPSTEAESPPESQHQQNERTVPNRTQVDKIHLQNSNKIQKPKDKKVVDEKKTKAVRATISEFVNEIEKFKAKLTDVSQGLCRFDAEGCVQDLPTSINQAVGNTEETVNSDDSLSYCKINSSFERDDDQI
ncbi:unnamed protein product [Bursaphelenchus okinawaensis]|uniref:Uncharacterized protein n=1 Tax=Bursaphelenchus okinawaensis TaxID=465554 RepID=A0A811KBG6_9BILA|nr:unnamed protein product [Bursaphelenchus okinawaensis]CAG9099172.1 unnamed protein product [Bursaphelenchus okinawaensis]